MNERTRPLTLAAAALVVVQVVHGAIPSGLPEDEGGSVVGLFGGLLLLVASIIALVGVARGRQWAVTLLGVTGAIVAVGFVLYHAVPVKSALTNPYMGEDGVTIAAWIGVAASIVIGAWCAWLAFAAPQRQSLAVARDGT